MDLGMTQDFLEVIEECYHHKRALAISAQLLVKEWPSVFKDATIADAVLDRIVRNAYRFDLKEPSRRQTVEHMPADTGDDNTSQNEYAEKQMSSCLLGTGILSGCYKNQRPNNTGTNVRMLQDACTKQTRLIICRQHNSDIAIRAKI